MENNATPRPWRLMDVSHDCFAIMDGSNMPVITGSYRDKLELIVEAVNNCALLKEENQRLKGYCDEKDDEWLKSHRQHEETLLSNSEQITRLTAANAELISGLKKIKGSCQSTQRQAIEDDLPIYGIQDVKSIAESLLSKHSST